MVRQGRRVNHASPGASAPDPDQEALPLGSPPRAVALGTIHFGAGTRGADTRVERSLSAPLVPAPMDRLQRSSTFAGGPGGKAPGGFEGQSPRAYLVHRLPCNDPSI